MQFRGALSEDSEENIQENATSTRPGREKLGGRRSACAQITIKGCRFSVLKRPRNDSETIPKRPRNGLETASARALTKWQILTKVVVLPREYGNVSGVVGGS